MSRTLFENSKAALAFAGLVIVGAGMFAATQKGTDGAQAPVTEAAGEASAKPSAPAQPRTRFADGKPADDWFGGESRQVPIEELIDKAKGFDPLPARSTEPGSQDYVIVEESKAPAPRGVGDPVSDGPSIPPDERVRSIADALEPGALPGSGGPGN